jgi:hypothetical protein
MRLVTIMVDRAAPISVPVTSNVFSVALVAPHRAPIEFDERLKSCAPNAGIRIGATTMIYKGEVHKGEHAPILDCELFEAVQARLAERKVLRKLARSKFENATVSPFTNVTTTSPAHMLLMQQTVWDVVRNHLPPQSLRSARSTGAPLISITYSLCRS